MSRAFVKEGDGGLDPLPDLPQSSHPNYVTRRGLAALRARLLATQTSLAALRARAERMDKLPEAAAERDIRYLEARLRSAILVGPAAQNASKVSFGHVVLVCDANGIRTRFEIVGEDEADAHHGRITPQSPLARAMIGAAVGDVLVWRKPSGGVELEILSIEFIDPPA